MSSGISLFSWNVNGLRAVMRKGSLRDFVDKFDPDILLLQETKISEAQVAESGVREDFGDYAQFYSFAKKPGYAGTAVWLRSQTFFSKESLAKKSISKIVRKVRFSDDFDICTAPDELCDGYGDMLDEGRLTVVELGELYVISAYVPNAKRDLSRLWIREKWDRYLTDALVELQKKKPVVIAGDFNVAHEPIDLARPKQNVGKHGYTDEERRGFSELLARAGMVDSFRALYPDTVKYSWWSHFGNARANDVGWRIDYVLVSKALQSKVKSAEVYPEVMGSDHCPVSIELAL